MRKLLMISSLLIMTVTVFAQDKTVKGLKDAASKNINIDDTAHTVWRTGGIFNINLSQGALSYWAAGGDKNSLSINSLLNAYASYKKGRNSWDNQVDMAYGYLNTTSQGFRKSDDRADLTSKYGYEVAKKWYLTGLFDLKTQFSNGYEYSDTSRTLTSAAFSPAYILLSLGMDYKPNDNFDVFISPISSRWTVVSNNMLSAQGKYGVDSGKHVYNEIGAFLSANFRKDFTKSISYKSRLDLFSNYRQDPQNVDLYFTNLLALKITKYLTTTVSLDMIYDDNVTFPDKNGNQSPHLQLKEGLGLGFSYKF